MERRAKVALGLEALILAGVAAAAGSRSPASSRAPATSTAKHAFAARDPVSLLSAPRADAAIVGTFGLGSGFLVGDPVGPFYPVVREWINEDGSRTTRNLAWIATGDLTFKDPRAPALAFAAALPVTRDDKPLLGRSDAGECDHFVKFAFADGVNDFKDLLNRVWSSTDVMINACPSISAANKTAWRGDYENWKQFYANKAGFLNSGSQWDNSCISSRTLDGWRDLVGKYGCETVGPTTVRGYELPESTLNALSSIATIVKWGALIAGGTILFTTFYPEIKSGLGALRAARPKPRPRNA